MNCIISGKITNDSCFGCKIKVGNCDIKPLLDKQKPMPVIKTTQPFDVKVGALTFCAGTTVRRCPVCNNWVTPTMKYCCDCGQKLAH